MSIRFSDYVREGKKTFRFIRMGGGAYGCNIAYEYGYFSGNKLRGTRYSFESHTEVEDDPDEKDGIGSMRTVRSGSFVIGSFTDGKRDGFCCELMRDGMECADDITYYEMDRPLSFEEFKEKSEVIDLDDGRTAYLIGEDAYVMKGDVAVHTGQLYADGEPCFFKSCSDEGEVEAFGFYLDDKSVPFVFDDWETMPVDPVDEDGFSVLREMDFFSSSNLRYKITEGEFRRGKLCGFGTEYYDSYTNGYHKYTRKCGLFRDGELVFGYSGGYENAGKWIPDSFGYADGRDISEYGHELVYDGKKYIGEQSGGIPDGIGCLFDGEDEMTMGTFRDGKLHGIGATFKRLDGEWVPYDRKEGRSESSGIRNSYGIFAEGELLPDTSWEEFFDKYESLKKV